MAGIVTLLVTLTIAMLVTRVGAAALKLTGLSEDVARFQARSAFTGVGFTTNEAEKVVNHPVRRRIIGILMLSGNVGIAAVIASLIATFAVDTDSQIFLLRLAFVAAVVVALWVIGTQQWVDRSISATIEWALMKWTKFDAVDYVALLRLSSGYVVLQLEVQEEDWVANRALSDTNLALEGVLVLGIRRSNGDYLGSPSGRSEVHVGDMLTVYGKIERLEELNLRKAGRHGDREHKAAVQLQQEIEQAQDVEVEVE